MSNSKHFALLIGVDFYIKKPLNSCVRDVNLLETYLKTLQQDKRLEKLEITRLTASNPTHQGPNPRKPPEGDDTVPNLQNVRNHLARITSESTKDDYVFVHFSGHGTVLPQGSLAFVLFGCEDQNGRLRDCLTGDELANSLNKMVTEGVKVLLALDCCYSGKISRRKLPDPERYIPFVGAPDPEYVEKSQDHAHLGATCSDATVRGASARENWLMDPKGYTIITACGPTQTTGALRFKGGKLYGALTYTLFKSLDRLKSLNMSHMAIFQFICARFRAMESKQVPQMKGSGDFSFFGHLQASDDSFFPLVVFENGKIMIQAGEIMGVHENDKLVLVPLNNFTDEVCGSKYVLATAHDVGGVTANVNPINPRSKIDAGWVARPHKLCQQASTTTDEAANRSSHGGYLQENPVFLPSLTEATAPFKAKINDQGGFDIQDSQGQRVDFDGLSLLPAHSPTTRPQILRVLAYLARYHEIINMKPSTENETLRADVDVKICNESGAPFPETRVISVKNEEQIRLSIVNNGENPVFVHILYLSGDWEIENLLANENTRLFSDSTITGEQDITQRQIELVVRMMIPEQNILRGIHTCDDIFKVFVTTQPAPFAHLSAVRPLLRGSPAEVEDRLQDSWTAWTFHIHTELNQALSL
ncbi:hypothetical protein NCS57_00860000 [Fusarium keratoplasticum]|uniref:Uncharacterized protein n=1 Tax=Fusarium keratoplasticum TaxID=1328300 RepID=A0ACC0QSR1_9HYPO|nr:hypothetical protein NCS57_00860000 [Fusarium keratoplasticum]KAI8666355.1 hypothetical protein NCS57_00860000 [Fusarium keratoplasticum]KAI8668055.1 hypothetical protein NCS55_00829600 [Fusarium keratoplasticum]